jgi:SWI/SNF-related matrix-associated actin-dependent regulator 1 of chromatin subfamily A
MLEKIYISRNIDDTLPPLTFGKTILPISDLPNEAYKQGLNKTTHKLQNLLKNANSDDEILQILDSEVVDLATERRLLGLIKANKILQLVEEELAGNSEKRIIFAWHRDVLDVLYSGLKAYGAVLVDGRTSDSEDQKSVDAFQNDPNTRVFIGQMQKCEEGLTLTAANHVIIAEPSWTPKSNYQAAKRASRMGQKHAVLARFMVLENSLDEMIVSAIMRKTEGLAAIFGETDIKLNPQAKT